mmetsp:Transcript_37937/g.60924  ORF Transcript_37937/g.60924 Transcript_37937/m.60924 type:complete len:229 (-) Transcript_37937:881-1567(-)
MIWTLPALTFLPEIFQCLSSMSLINMVRLSFSSISIFTTVPCVLPPPCRKLTRSSNPGGRIFGETSFLSLLISMEVSEQRSLLCARSTEGTSFLFLFKTSSFLIRIADDSSSSNIPEVCKSTPPLTGLAGSCDVGEKGNAFLSARVCDRLPAFWMDFVLALSPPCVLRRVFRRLGLPLRIPTLEILTLVFPSLIIPLSCSTKLSMSSYVWCWWGLRGIPISSKSFFDF